MFARYQRRYRGHARAACTLATVLGYLIAYIGMPVPRQVAKDLSAPFPCAHRTCGCASAAQCWKQCCCFSDEQKIAWAKANHVMVPDEVLERFAQSQSKSPSRSCCAKRAAATGCCATKVARAEPTSGVTWVLGIEARKCRGQGVDWLSVAAVVPPADHVAWMPCGEAIEPVLMMDSLLESAPLAPPVPPPRLG